MAQPNKKTILSFAIFTMLVAVWYLHGRSEVVMLKPIQELRVRFTPYMDIPDPTNIQFTGDWYYLDHISSGLVRYDSSKKTFVPNYAETWSSEADGTHVFKLRPGIKFHDGTPITTKDFIWSIKRHLILKKSTHFKLWEYILDCDNLKSLDQECAGLRADGNNISIRLQGSVDSFYLQLASPETGIWAAEDMDPVTLKLTPKKFSGPYYFSEKTDSYALLKRNEKSLISQEFPNSPRAIRLRNVPIGGLDQAVSQHELDLIIRAYSPLGEKDWKSLGINVQATTASSIIYLSGLGVGDRAPVGRDFIEALWQDNKDDKISPAISYLPFAQNYGLTRPEFLDQLAEHSAKKLRILCPVAFFSAPFLEQIKSAAQKVGTELEISFAQPADFFKTMSDKNAKDKYDYVLSNYAASERYPAMQLRNLTKSLVTPPLDLNKAEQPLHNDDRIKILRDYEKWLLSSRQAIPIYFSSTLFIFQKNIDLGEQPSSDAEIELWRVQEKSP